MIIIDQNEADLKATIKFVFIFSIGILILITWEKFLKSILHFSRNVNWITQGWTRVSRTGNFNEMIKKITQVFVDLAQKGNLEVLH